MSFSTVMGDVSKELGGDDELDGRRSIVVWIAHQYA
jgi:hypothetical protein